jgi:hypothetical protein
LSGCGRFGLMAFRYQGRAAGSTLPRHGPDRIVILFTSSVHCGETRSERVARPAEAAFFTG